VKSWEKSDIVVWGYAQSRIFGRPLWLEPDMALFLRWPIFPPIVWHSSRSLTLPHHEHKNCNGSCLSASQFISEVERPRGKKMRGVAVKLGKKERPRCLWAHKKVGKHLTTIAG
jgi:hypothetical protein